MAKKKRKPSDQVRYGAQPFQTGSINDVAVQEAIAGPGAQSSRALSAPEYVPPTPTDTYQSGRDYTVDEYRDATGADRGAIGEFIGVEGPTNRERRPVFSDPDPGARSTRTVLTNTDREKTSNESITAQNLADAEALPQGNDPLAPEYYPAERTRPNVSGMSRADALRMLPMDLSDDWDAAQDFSYDNYPNLMRAAQQSSLSVGETRDLVNITLAVETARMVQSSVDPMRRQQLMDAMNPQQRALVLDVIGAMEQEVLEQAASFPMNEQASGEAPGQTTQVTTQQDQQNPIAQFVSDTFVTPSIDLPGSFMDSVDYGPFKDGKFYWGGTGAWNTLVDVGETGLQGTRAAMLRGNTGDGSWSDAWNAASMGTFDPTMVAAIKENHDPLMVDVGIAWKKHAHSGAPDRFAAVLDEFEGNSAAMRHVDKFIEPEPGSEYELVSNALDVSETGNLAVLAAWAGAQGAGGMTLSSTPIAGMLYEAAGLKKDASNYEDIVGMAENEVGRSLMKLGNFGSVFVTDPFLVTGVVGKGVRGARYGLWRMSGDSSDKVWQSRAVQRYWDNLGNQFDEVRAMSNEADKATRLNSIAAQNKNWFKDREAIYTMYNMGVKDTKTAKDFIESGENVELLLRGQAAKRKSSRYVPHQHAATAVFKASMMFSRRALQGKSAAKQIDMVFGEGTAARLPSEALPGILRVLEENPENAGRLLNDFVYVDDEGVRTFSGKVVDVVRGTPRANEGPVVRAAQRIRGTDSSPESVAAEKARGVIDPDDASKTDVRKQRYGWKRQKGKLWTRLGRLGARQAFRKPISVRDGRDAGEVKKLVQGYGMSTQFANYMEYLWRSDALTVAERHQLAQGLNRTAIYSSGLDLVAPALARSMEDTITTIADRAGTKYAPDQLDVVSIRARAENRVRQLNNERREDNMREFTAQEVNDQLQKAVDEITAMEIKRLDDARDAARKQADEFEARLASAPDEGMPATPQESFVEVTLPPAYWGDARPRLSTLEYVDDADLIVKKNSKGVTVRLTADQYDDIVGDLDYYLNKDVMEGVGLSSGFVSSFRAAKKRMDAIERPNETTVDEAAPSLSNEPGITLYHGTNRNFDELSENADPRGGPARMKPSGRRNIYFTDNQREAQRFAGESGDSAMFPDPDDPRFRGLLNDNAGDDAANLSDEEKALRVVQKFEDEYDFFVIAGPEDLSMRPATAEEVADQWLNYGTVYGYPKGQAPRIIEQQVSGQVLDIYMPPGVIGRDQMAAWADENLPEGLRESLGPDELSTAIDNNFGYGWHETSDALTDWAWSQGYAAIRVNDSVAGAAGGAKYADDAEYYSYIVNPDQSTVRAAADEAAPVADELPPSEIPVRGTEDVDEWINGMGAGASRDRLREDFPGYRGPQDKPVIRQTPMKEDGKVRGPSEGYEFEVMPTRNIADADSFDPKDGAWTVVHTPHGGLINVPSARSARELAESPGEFCPSCQMVEDGIRGGYIVNDGGILVYADEALGRTVPESPYESFKDARASVGDDDGVPQAIRDDIQGDMDANGLGNPSALDDTSNYALYQYQLANNVRMLDPSRLDAFAARASYLNALLGNGPTITTAVDIWTIGTLAGPRFVMRSGAEDWALFALTGGSIFGKNSWWSNRRRSRAIREATNDDPLESKKGPVAKGKLSKGNKGKKVSVATTLARDVAAVPFLRSIMTRWLSEDELKWAARQATEKGFDEGKREGLAWMVGTAMARSRYWSLGNRKAYKEYRDELDALIDERDALKKKKALAEANKASDTQVSAIQGSIDAKDAEIGARIEQGIDGVKTQEADDIIANGVRFGYLNHSMDAASESGSSLASGTRPHRPADDVQTERVELKDPGLEFGLTTPGGGTVRREVFSGSETKIRFDDKWKPEDIDDLYQELNGVLHMDDQLAYLALARSRQYYNLRRAVAQGKENAQEDLDAFLREIVDMVDDEGNRVFDFSGFVLAADGNLGEQGFVDRVFSDVLRLVTTADGSYNNTLINSMLLPSWRRVQVSDELALSLGFNPSGRKSGTYVMLDQELWDDAYKRAGEDDKIMLEAAGRPILIQNSSGGVSKRKFGLRYVDAEGKTKLNLDQTALAAMKELPQTVGHQNFIPIIATNEIPRTTKLWNMMGRALARLTREPIYLTNYVDSVKMLKASDWFEKTVKMHEDAMRGRVSALGDDSVDAGLDIPTEARTRAERDAHEKAADMAYDLTMAYVDNPEIRSQLAWQVRNIARFYRALEDFYRRMLRTTQNDPTSLLKGAIAFKAFDESGFTWEDEYGERYFIFPGTQAMFSAYNQMMAAFGLDQRMPTLPVAFGARLSMVMPSTDPNAAIPMLGSPWASLTLKSAIRVAPTLATVTGRSRSQAEEMSDALEGMLFGEYAPQQSMFNSLINDTIGPNVKRVIDAGLATAMPDSRLGQSETGFASTAKQALHIVLSELYDPAKEFKSESAKQAYQEEMMAAVDTTALNIMIWKALTTPLLIATPQVTGTGVSDMAREIGITGYDTVWLTYLNKYPNDYEKAMIEFTKNHPGKAIFTTSKYEGTAFYESTIETEEFIKNNRDFFDDNPVGLSYFAPQNGVYGGLGTFYFMRANGVKYPKSVENMLKQSLSAEGDNLLRSTQAKYDVMRSKATSTEQLKQIKKDEQVAKDEIKAMYPFTDLDDSFELDDTKKKATAEQIDDAARYMIESGQDESGMAQKTREVYSSYKFMLDRKTEYDDPQVSQQINSDWSRYVENELMSLFPGNEQWIRVLQVLTRNINAQSGTLDLLRIEEGAA